MILFVVHIWEMTEKPSYISGLKIYLFSTGNQNSAKQIYQSDGAKVFMNFDIFWPSDSFIETAFDWTDSLVIWMSRNSLALDS